MKDTVASADMRRHSDTLRGAHATTEKGSMGENVSVSVSEQANVVTR